MGIETPFIIIVVFFSVVCHEIAHGYIALKLGDPTAYNAGRLTFNPIPHIDPFGTVLLPVLFIIMKSPVMLAWAKPVPVNPRYFRNPKQGMMWVAIAGPATNFIIALLITAILHLTRIFGIVLPEILLITLIYGAIINILLMVFNLLPVPPLDGSRIVANFLQGQTLLNYRRLEKYGLFIVFGLLWIGFLGAVLMPTVKIIGEILGLNHWIRL